MSVEKTESPGSGQPITVTITRKDSPNRRDVYLIEPQTKLVECLNVYRRGDGESEWKKVSTIEYFDYNRPIDPSVWEPQLPADVTAVDQTSHEIGLAKGDLSDNEIAVKVAREFFQALIAKDYGKAGQILEGIPASKMKETFGGTTFLRIVEVGQPRPHPNPATHFIQVPVKVEMEADGKKMVKEITPNIRAAYNQPGRWVIGGGI